MLPREALFGIGPRCQVVSMRQPVANFLIQFIRATLNATRNEKNLNTNMSVIPQQQLLGQGTFGSVYKVYNSKNEPFVVKVIKKDSIQKPEDMKREIEAGNKLKHKSIVKVTETQEDANNWYIFMEFIEGENLLQYVQRTMKERNGQFDLPQALVKNIVKQLVQGLCHSHKQGIAHLDLKLENVMFSNKKKVKIVDFGLCSNTNISGYHTRFVGSPDYMAPEVIQRKAYRPDKADVWSLGTILYILLTGEMPFSRSSRKQFAEGATHPKLNWEDAEKVPKKAKDLVEKMLAVNPEDRITMDQVRKHPWLRWF